MAAMSFCQKNTHKDGLLDYPLQSREFPQLVGVAVELCLQVRIETRKANNPPT